MIDSQLHQREVEEAVAYLRKRLDLKPEVVVQLGTGLGDFAAILREPRVIPYRDIPFFPEPTVTSHRGNLVCGFLNNCCIAVLQGRFHYYEGYTAREVAFPIRVLSLLGAKIAVITNASGGLRSDCNPGSIMILNDHINLIPDNPLRGPNIDEWGDRFPDLSQPYDKVLRDKILGVAAREKITDVSSGTYVCIPGPSLETPAETRYLKLIGGDAVGMSSVPEVITAIHAGMRVLGVSVVANVNDPDNFQPILLKDIVQAAGEAGPRLEKLIVGLLMELE